MATLTYRASSTASLNGAASVGPLNVPIPEGTKAGDVLLIFVAVSAAIAVTAPSGLRYLSFNTSGALRIYAWSHLVMYDYTPGAALSFTLDTPAQATAIITAYQSPHPAGGGVTAEQYSYRGVGSGTSFTSQSITTTEPTKLISVAVGQSSLPDWAISGGDTQRAISKNTGPSGLSLALFESAIVAPGNHQRTLTTSSSITSGSLWTFALPASLTEDPPLPENMFDWSGTRWVARSNTGGPTANDLWDPQNVQIDGNGHLRLAITRVNDTLYAAEARTTQSGWGYGTYRIKLASPVHLYEHNIVVGIFTFDYLDPAYGRREIDFEASSWGDSTAPVAWTHTFWSGNGSDSDSHIQSSTPAPTDANVEHVLEWTPEHLYWVSYRNDGSILSEDIYTGPNRPIPGGESFVLNLWVFNGANWQASSPAELVFESFDFTPYRPASEPATVIDLWNGTALVRQKVSQWNGTSLNEQTLDDE